jgi:hypothetical protein
MRPRSLCFHAAFLFVLLNSQVVVAETTAEEPTVTLLINCDTNESTISDIRTEITKLLTQAQPLQSLRMQKQLTEPQNTELLGIETAVAEYLMMLSRHEYAQFYCDNQELLEEQQSPPVDPAAVA